MTRRAFGLIGLLHMATACAGAAPGHGGDSHVLERPDGGSPHDAAAVPPDPGPDPNPDDPAGGEVNLEEEEFVLESTPVDGESRDLLERLLAAAAGGRDEGRGSGEEDGWDPGGTTVAAVPDPPARQDLPGALGRDTIRSAVGRRRGALRRCHEAALIETPGVAGTVTVRIVIAPAGGVTSAAVSGNSTGNDGLARCIEREIGNLQFPQSASITTVVYPFRFDAGGMGE